MKKTNKKKQEKKGKKQTRKPPPQPTTPQKTHDQSHSSLPSGDLTWGGGGGQGQVRTGHWVTSGGLE